MKKFCESLREHAKNIINFEKNCYRKHKRNQNHVKVQQYVTFVLKKAL